MSDNNPDLAAQEVDEELRRDQLNAVWKAYGKYIIGGAVGIVLAVAGNEVYSSRVISAQEANAAAFEVAQKESVTEGADAAQVWADALPQLTDGYVALGELRLAQVTAKNGDIDAAIAAYDKIAASNQHDDVLKSFAQLMSALLIAEHKGNLDEARSRLSVLAIKGLPWYFSALEQSAFIDLQQDQPDAALSKFLLLAGDTQTPRAIQTRAIQFRDMLESQARAALPMQSADATADAVAETETEEGAAKDDE